MKFDFFFLPDSVELCMLSITFVDIFLSELCVHEYVFNWSLEQPQVFHF